LSLGNHIILEYDCGIDRYLSIDGLGVSARRRHAERTVATYRMGNGQAAARERTGTVLEDGAGARAPFVPNRKLGKVV